MSRSLNDAQGYSLNIINFIVEPPTICHLDQRAVTELGNMTS